jgi:hypothetical protein
MSTASVGGARTKVLTLAEPWDRVRKGRVDDGADAPVIDWIHRAVAVLEDGGTVLEAAQLLAEADRVVCEVIRALYAILPDQLPQGRRSMVNREKVHLKTLLLSVCQEGLHRIAKRQRDIAKPQRNLDDYTDQ